MSAPDANALSPAPVTTSTRTSGSASSAASTRGSAARISPERALRLAGLLKVTSAIALATSTSSLSVPVSPVPGTSDHPFSAELVNRVARVAQLIKHLVGMVTGVRARRPHSRRRIAHAHSVTHDFQLAEHRV